MSGKHGRRRAGRSDEPGAVTTSPGRHGDGSVSGADPKADAASSASSPSSASASSVPGARPAAVRAPAAISLPPAALIEPWRPPPPPTPPSLGPIRTSPLPDFVDAILTPAAEPPAPPAPVVDPPAVALEPVVQPPTPVVEVPPAPELVAEPVAALTTELVEVPPTPVVEAPPTPVVEVPPTPELVAEPVAALTPELVAEPVAALTPELVEVPVPVLTPTSHDPILPRRLLGSRGSAREEKAGRRRRVALASIAGVVVVALLSWWAVASTGRSSSKHPVVAAAGRTQTTLLIQLSGGLGAAVASALVAHDTAHHDGVVVLIPSGVVAQVPGFGSMPFGQALTVGDPNAPRTALSDLMGVTVDGSWSITPQAMAALVDRLGGITVTVDRDVTKTASDGTTTILVAAGTHKLNGASAVAFGTFLASDETEQARLARFDAVLKQILAGLPTGSGQLTTVLSGLGTGSSASFPPAKLAALLTGLAADSAANAMDDELLPVKQLDTGQDQSAFTLDATGTAKLVSVQLPGSVPTNRKATGNRVYVQNQVGTPGIGESTRSKLEAAGFVYIHGDNTEDMPNATAPSVVVIFGTTAAEIAEGQAVAKSLGLPNADVKVSDRGFTVADVAVKLGVDYKQ